MEYLPLGDLQRYLQEPLHVDEARTISHQLLEGLQVMHENQFVHRDMKPLVSICVLSFVSVRKVNSRKNILVVQKEPHWWVKIADFGITKRNQSTALRTTAGTEAYVAPEVMGFYPPDTPAYSVSEYSTLVDIWSLGVIVYQMVTAKKPFDNFGQLAQYVASNQAFFIDTAIPSTCADFIRKTMAAVTNTRPSAQKALKHDWFDGYEQLVSTGGVNSTKYSSFFINSYASSAFSIGQGATNFKSTVFQR
jgi:calcium/calmodulin-dependent protein kinase I